MTHDRQRRISVFLAILIVGASASPAIGRPVHRLRPIPPRPVSPIAGGTDQPRTPAPFWLTPTDRFNLSTNREHRVTIDFGSATLAMTSTRLHSGKNRDIGLPDRDSYSTTGVAFEVASPLAAGLTVSFDARLLSMRRRIRAVPSGMTAQRTHIAETGVTLSQERGLKLALDYLDVSAPTKGGAMPRMAALLGGAPLAGRGETLSISAPIGKPDGMYWELVASRMNRPSSDMEALGASHMIDNGLTLGIGWRF